MTKRWMRAAGGLGMLALMCGLLMHAQKSPAPTARIVSAANAFLQTLDAQQRQSVVYAFDDEQQRKRWSNFPISMVPRGGISLKDMTLAQRTAAMTLLSTVLSPRGFEKVQQIMEGDEVNTTTETNRPPRGPRGPGGPPPSGESGGGPPPGMQGRGPMGGPGGLLFGRDLYFLSFLGTPSEKTPWMLQFGGHHLAVNVTIAGDRGVLTPTLTGAQPSLFTKDGKTVRPLAGESDKAVLLLSSLDEAQKKQAVLSYRLADLVLGPG